MVSTGVCEESRSVADAGCRMQGTVETTRTGRCQRCHCRRGLSTVVLRGGRARLLPPPLAAAPGPTSEAEGGASRRGGARGAIRSPRAPGGGIPPEELLTYCDCTPVSLRTHDPGRVRRDLIWEAFLPWASGLRAERRDTQCDFIAALGIFPPDGISDIPCGLFNSLTRGSGRICRDPGLVVHLARGRGHLLHNLTNAPLGTCLMAITG